MPSTLESPARAGIYTLREAGRLARVPHSTVARWTELGVSAQPLYREAGSAALLTFADLISLLTVRELRRAKVPIDLIKAAERSLAKRWEVERPFAHGKIRTAYQAIVTVLAEGERPVAITGTVQEILHELIEKDLRDVSYDASMLAREWKPAAHVLIAPTRQLGQPCVEGTRVTTLTVYQFIAGGESFDELSEDLDVPVPLLRAAYEYEESLFRRPN